VLRNYAHALSSEVHTYTYTPKPKVIIKGAAQHFRVIKNMAGSKKKKNEKMN